MSFLLAEECTDCGGILPESCRSSSYSGADSYSTADCLLRLIRSGWSVLISVLCSVLVPVMALEGHKKLRKKGKQIKLTGRCRDISAYSCSASRSF